MAQFSNVVPATELEAVNAVLSAAGLVPIDQQGLDNPDSDDVEMVINTFRRVNVEAQTRGWRFNSRVGLQLTPVGTYDWNDGTVTTTLNVFKRPTAALSWRLTECAENNLAEAAEAPAFRYTEGTPPATPRILIDLLQNRDGFDAALYPRLFIDGAFGMDFEDTPTSFRAYVVAVTARRFVSDTVAADRRASLAQDEATAYSQLMRDQGIRRRANIFNEASAQRMLGYRQSPAGISRRVYRQS